MMRLMAGLKFSGQDSWTQTQKTLRSQKEFETISCIAIVVDVLSILSVYQNPIQTILSEEMNKNLTFTFISFL